MAAGKTGWHATLDEARRAEEEYDYDRALALYRQAAEMAAYGEEALVPLTAFLSDVYALNDDVVALLRGRDRQLRSNSGLRLALARACWLVGDADGASEQYAQLTRHELTHRDQYYLGMIAQQREQVAEALEWLNMAYEAAPADPDVKRALDAVRGAIADEGGAYVERAQQLLAHDPRAALVEISAMYDAGLSHPEAKAIVQRCEALLRDTEIASLLTTARESELLEARIAAYRAVLELAPDHEEARRALDGLQVEARRREVQQQIEVAIQQEMTDQTGDALASFARVAAIEGHRDLFGEWDISDDPLWQFLVPFIEQFGTQRAIEVADQLGRFYTIRQSAPGGEALAAALAQLAGGLAGFAAFEELQSSIADRQRAERLESARDQYARAADLEQQGRLAEALDAFDVAVRSNGSDFDDTGARRRTLKSRIAAEAERRALLQQAEELMSGGDYFEVRRQLRTLSAADELVSTALARAAFGIEQEFALTVGPLELARQDSAPLPLAELGFDATAAVSLLVSEDAQRLLLCGEKRIVELRLPDLRFGRRIELPARFPSLHSGQLNLFGKAGVAVLSVIDLPSRQLALLKLDDRAVGVEMVCGLGRNVDPQGGYLVARKHPGDQRLLALRTAKDKRASVVLSVALDGTDAKVLESHSFQMHHLAPIDGAEQFLVMRYFDFQRGVTPGFFNLGLLDAQGRVTRRFVFDEILDDVGSLAWASVDLAGRIHANYRIVNGLTGEVLPDKVGYLVIRPDGELFYQSSRADHLVGPKRKISAPFAFSAEGDLVVGYRGEETNGGVQLLASDDFALGRHLELPAGFVPQQLRRAGSHVMILARNADGDGALCAVNTSQMTLD